MVVCEGDFVPAEDEPLTDAAVPLDAVLPLVTAVFLEGVVLTADVDFTSVLPVGELRLRGLVDEVPIPPRVLVLLVNTRSAPV